MSLFNTQTVWSTANQLTVQGSEAVEFQCKTKSTQDNEEIKDEIDFSIAKKSGRGVSVKVKYEQEVEVGTESKEDESKKDDDGKQDDKQDEQKQDEETMQDEGDANEKNEQDEEKEGVSDASETAQAEEEKSVEKESAEVSDTVEVEKDEPVTGAEKDAEDKESSVSESTVTEEKLNVSGRQLQAVQETEYQTEFEVVFERILEYANADGSGSLAYDWDSDTIVQEVDLKDLGDFADFEDDGNTVTFKLSSLSGHASFQFTISRSTVEGAPATANKMKIDVTLTGFPWQRSDTYLALVCAIESKQKVEVEYEDGTKKKPQDVIVGFGESSSSVSSPYIPFGSYTWATEATASTPDNTTNATLITEPVTTDVIQVLATSPASNGGNVQLIAFSFVGEAAKSAPTIYWDPQAGVDYLESTSSATRAAGFIATLISLGALMFLFSF